MVTAGSKRKWQEKKKHLCYESKTLKEVQYIRLLFLYQEIRLLCKKEESAGDWGNVSVRKTLAVPV